mgnify:FL=1
MGGVAGHMSHLSDNGEMKFSEMKDVFSKASSGELIGTEKTDGVNLFISYSVPTGTARAARNKSNIKSGGMTAAELAAKFEGRGALADAFNNAFYVFEKAVSSLPQEQQISIFGPDANVYYNAEVMSPGSNNIIDYDKRTLLIHQVGHAEFDKTTGNVSGTDVEANVKALKASIEDMQRATAEDDFSVEINSIRKLQGLSDDVALKNAVSRLSKLVSSSGLSADSTINDYIVSKVAPVVMDALPGSPIENKRELVKRIMGVKGASLAKVTKGISAEDKTIARELVKNSKQTMKKILFPLEDIVHDFAVEMLKGLNSAFVLDNQEETGRIRNNVAKAISAIENSGNEEAMSILKQNMQKLKDIEKVSTAAEGFVFDYNGRTYKFTGNFAPVNQILGLFKFGRGNVPPLQSNELTEASRPLTVAIVPGGFKPPHAGHYLAAEWFFGQGADEVHVLIGRKNRVGNCEEQTVDIDENQSLALWSLYAKENGTEDKFKISIAASATPVRETYEMLEAFPEGTVVLLGRGEKDINDKRFDRAPAYAAEHNPGITVKQLLIPMMAGGVSGTKMRNEIIACGDKETFGKYIPVDRQEAIDEAWDIVTSKKKADSIQEMIKRQFVNIFG